MADSFASKYYASRKKREAERLMTGTPISETKKNTTKGTSRASGSSPDNRSFEEKYYSKREALNNTFAKTEREAQNIAELKQIGAINQQNIRRAKAQTYLDTARNATQKNTKNSRYVADTTDMKTRLDELKRRNKEITPYVAAAQKTGAENMKSYLDEFTENNRLIRQLESDIEAAKAGETISHVDDLKLQLEQAKREEALAKTESDKYMGYSRSMPVDPAIASASIAKTKAASEKVKAIEQELERIAYINEQSGKTYEDTFSGQFGANKTLGRLGQEVGDAYNEYLTTGNEDDKAYADALALLTERYQVENKLALDDEGAVLPWVSKSLAGYLPQFWDQTKAQLAGGAVGALGGLAVGNPLAGAKIGATVATGIQSYGQMRGAAYQELINAGVDEETARAAASDEAVLSALIEMGDTALELATFGTGKLLKALGKGGVKAVAGEAAESGVKKLIKALGKYGLDVGQEMLEEGTQQAVSIANRNRSLEGNTGLWNLTKSTALTTKDAVSGKDAEARAEIWDAAKEGGKIAAMMGGVNRVADLTTEAALRGAVNAIDRRQVENLGSDYQVAATKIIEEGLSFPSETEAHRVAQEVMEKLSRDGSVSDYDLGRVVVATERTMRQQEAQEQPAVSDEETLQLARETVAAQQNAPQAASQTESVDTKAVPLNVMSMETPEVKAKLARKANTAKWTGYGDAGVKAFDEVVEKSGQTREAVRTVFQSAYETGLAGVELEHVKDSIVSDVQEAAYLAGREDYVAGLGRKASTNVSGKAGFNTKGLPKDVADWEVKAIDTMARELGVSVSMTDDDGYNGRITGSGVLLSTTFQREFDGKKVGLLFHGAHEIGVHRVLQLAPKEGRAFVNAMYRYLTKDAPATDATLAEKKQAHYGAHDVELSTADAMEELAANAVIQLYGDDPKAYADAVERVLSGKDEQAKKGLAKFKEVLGEIVQKIRRAISKLTGRELQEAQRDLSEIEKLRDLLETAMKAAQAQAKAAQAEQKNTAQTDGGTRLSINESYSEQMLAWDGKSKRVFTLGTTSEALRSIGIRDSKIVLYSGKATDILNNPDHDMDQKTLAKLPDVLENPIAILKSQQVTEQNKKINDGNTSRLVIFGTVEDTKGVPVSVVLELMPTKGGKVLELSVVASAYGKTTHLSGFVQSSEVLYLDENKKRTNGWLQSVGVQFPSDAISYGSMGRVTYIDGKVKIKGTPFSKISGSTYISAPKQAAPMENWQKQLLEYRSKLNEQDEKSQFSLRNSTVKIDTEGMSDEAKEIIGNLKIRAMSSRYNKGEYASYTSERIEREIRTSYAERRPDYAKSYIAWVEPADFLYATTTSKEGREQIEQEAGTLDLEKLRGETQPIHLTVDFETGEIKGHEGRHRMVALSKAGVQKVAVIFDAWNDDRYNTKPIDMMRIGGQRFSEYSRGIDFYAHDILPLSARYADAARQLFSEVGGSVKFSMKEPVEEKKNLIALHNLSEEKLLKSLNLGGFPMPSIAVTKSDIPHTNFGDITLVMSKSTIDPKASRKNTVYSADAWTPTFPQVEYDVNPASEYALYDMVRRAGERLPDGYRSRVQMMASSIESYLNNTGTVEGVIERFKDEYAIKALYLTDKGETVERKTQEVHHEKQTNETFDAVLQLFDEDIDTLSKTPLNELHQKYAEDIKRVLVENGRTEKQAELAVAKNGGLVGGFAKYISRILRYAQEPAYTTETVEDTDAMEQDIDSRIDAKEYVKWLRDMFQGLILDSGIYNGKDIYTASGNRRSFKQTHYPLTLENVVKAMAAQNGGNSKHVTGFVGIKSLRAGAAVRFKSIAHMHELEGRLKHLTQEEADAVNDALSKRLNEITERIYSKKQHSKYDNVFIEYDTIGNILMEVTEQDKYTVDTIQKVFSQYQYTIGNQLAADIRDLLFDVSEMLVNIFEAKPERAVRFDEVLAAVIPNTSSDKLREGLKNAGVKVLEYAQDDNAARLELVNSVEDAKFSLKDDGKLERENARLKEVNQNLRDQFKRTKFAKVDKKSLDVFTKKLLKDYKSGADINDVREALDAVYTYMGNGDRDGQPPVWDDLMQKAYVVAQNILTNVVELDTEMYDEYKSLRDYLRTTGISISRDYEHDLGPYENLAEFRRANMGRIKIVNDGLPIDRAFQELAANYPGFFDEYDTTNPADQLLRLEEVLDSLQPVERNPYTHDMRNHATWLANDILERFFELPQAKPTYADKAAKKLADTKYAERRKTVELREAKDARIRELIEEKRKEVREAALGERMASGREIAKLKRAYEEKEAKASETRRSSGLRGRIERHAAEMSQKLLKPDDKHHVPQELRAPVAALLDAINLESQYTIDPETGKRVKNGGGDPVKRSQAFNNLRVAYQKIIEEDSADIVVDPAITAMLDRVSQLREVKLAEMSYSELETIWQVLRVVEHTVNNAGKLLSQEKYERTTEWAEAFVDDTETRRTKRGGKLEGIRLDLENPYTFFNHYGDAGHAVYRMLRDAQDKQQLMTGNVAEAVEKIVDPKTVRKLEKEVHEIKTERGVKLVLTKAQIMDIYLLTKRRQAQEHLMQGGIVQPEVESRHIKRGTDAVLLSYNDLQAIVGKMTVEDRKIAIRLQELTKTTLANYGNAASLKAYGYKKFTGDDYWPIKSAKEGVHSNVEKGAGNTRSIKNIGLAKSVMPHANNPLDIGGIFKTFASHSADMIDYAAWLCPMEDANRLFNFQFRDEAGMRTGKTIKGLLDRYGGRGSQEYWHRLMEDIQNGIKLQSDTNIMKTVDKVIGNVRGASVGANLRVIIQQPTAILRAAAVLSPADMAAGLVGGGGWKAALKHSAIAQRKNMGGFDISSPAQMQEILFDSKDKLTRFNEAMMWGAGKADAVTWGRIWSACEAAVKRKNKNLKPKSEEFYEAVDALFTEVIDQTQVVDGVLQRSQAMRSKNATLNQATAFMGEPTMAMNMLLRAYDGLVGEQDSKKRSAAFRKFGRTAMVLLVTNGVNALAQSIIDAARDDEDEEYWNKFWSAFTGLTGEEESAWQKAWAVVMGGNLGSSINPATYVPFAKDLISIMSGYDVTRADADAMKDIVDAFSMLYESAAGNKKRTVGYAVKNLAQQVGKVFGISAPNLLRDVWGITRTIALETGNIPLQYEMEKAIYNVEGEGNVSRFVDILYKAYTEDQAAYRHIYADLKSGGFDMDKIQSAMESRMKKAQGVTKVDDLDQRYLNPEQQTAYDKKVKSISKSDLWKSAKTSQRDELKGSLYDLTVMNGDGEKLKEKIDEGRGYGIDETEYLLYTMALDMADTPNKHGKLGGTPTNAEKADAISMVGGLSDSEIAFLWDTEQGYEAYAAGIDMKAYIDVLGEGGSVNVEKLVDAKAYDISEESYFDFLDSLKEHDQPTESGKLGTFTQAEATAAIAAMPGLTDAQRAYLWQSVNKSWKENKNPWR